MVDMVMGQLGDEDEQAMPPTSPRSSLLRISSAIAPRAGIPSQGEYMAKKTQAASVEAIKMLNKVLLPLSPMVPVDY